MQPQQPVVALQSTEGMLLFDMRPMNLRVRADFRQAMSPFLSVHCVDDTFAALSSREDATHLSNLATMTNRELAKRVRVALWRVSVAIRDSTATRRRSFITISALAYLSIRFAARTASLDFEQRLPKHALPARSRIWRPTSIRTKSVSIVRRRMTRSTISTVCWCVPTTRRPQSI